MARPEREASIAAALDRLFAEAKTQGDFTAARAAAGAGVSRQLLYRVAGDQYRAMKARLPGGRAGDDLAGALRRENKRLERQLRDAQHAHSDCPKLEDIMALVELNERLDEENRALRDRLSYLLDRLDREGARMSIDTSPQMRLPPAHLRAIPNEPEP